MSDLVPLFLYLHVLGAIVAFGPTFTLPYLATRAGREPQHANFMARASLAVSKGIIVPVALSMAVTGALIIWSAGMDLTAADHRWLVLAIVLYVIAIGYSILVQTPAGRRIVELTSSPPPPGATGPPPELLAAIRRARAGSLFLMVMVLVIAFLMVVKPQF